MNHLYEENGNIHTCDSGRAISHDSGTYLVWTKCGIDVPANQSFKSKEVSNCSNCAEPLENKR